MIFCLRVHVPKVYSSQFVFVTSILKGYRNEALMSAVTCTAPQYHELDSYRFPSQDSLWCDLLTLNAVVVHSRFPI